MFSYADLNCRRHLAGIMFRRATQPGRLFLRQTLGADGYLNLPRSSTRRPSPLTSISISNKLFLGITRAASIQTGARCRSSVLASRPPVRAANFGFSCTVCTSGLCSLRILGGGVHGQLGTVTGARGCSTRHDTRFRPGGDDLLLVLPMECFWIETLLVMPSGEWDYRYVLLSFRLEQTVVPVA